MSAVSLGVLTVLPTLVAAALLWWRRSSRESAFGVWTGVGALLLYIAWLHRDGPGTTCWRTATAGGCDEHLNPLPWLVLGAMLFVGGIVGYAARRR